MPNWIANRIIFTGDESDIKEILERIKNDEYGIGTIDFNKVIPMPESLSIEAGSRTNNGLKKYGEFISECMLNARTTDISKLSDEFIAENEKEFLKRHNNIKQDEWELGKTAWNNRQKYGFPSWYEWSINMWGTKWNACGYDNEADYSQNDSIYFQTAWSAPIPVIKKLSELYPSIEMNIRYADEDLGQNCGELILKGGEVINKLIPKTNKEALEFAAEVWDSKLENYGFHINQTGTDYVPAWKEDFELINLFGKPALYSDERLTPNDVPLGLNLYHIRRGDYDDTFSTLESNVTVNHGGSVILNENIDLGEKEYIDFTEQTEPEFIGQTLSIDDYINERFSMEEQRGDMKLC